jgi:alpha-1,3-mannosyl-glycoprotein beta-1,2-N-acetylglucosaminyltransferase
VKKVYGSPTVTLQQLQRSEISIEGSVRVTYSTKDGFKKSAKALGLMDDFKVIEISIKKK